MSLRFRSKNPDILMCLANLSSDEVFTPPKTANDMLDLLPQELFRSPETKFLDPACKSGVFLREIVKRLIIGLEDKIPDLQERVNHIMSNQVYGIAVTELTAMISRRTVYCSMNVRSRFSVCKFDDEEGRIKFRAIRHTYNAKGRCIYCGEKLNDNKEGTHAYEFIHTVRPEEIWNMKFDVIISNPPYQMEDGGGGAGKGAIPIYQLFVDMAKKLQPKYITMIIPSRWFSGGKGLDNFRYSMLKDEQISQIVEYSDSKSCFSGVDISGGICYFLWEHGRKGSCTVTNILNDGSKLSVQRRLDEFDILISNNNAVPIVRKILSKNEPVLSSYVYSRKPFGLDSNTKFDDDGDIILRSLKGIGKVRSSRITSGLSIIGKWKVIVSKVSFEHAGVPGKDGTMRVLSVIQVLPPDSACTESYLVAGAFDNESCANNLMNYLKTKFARFLIMQMLASMNMSKASYNFVPMQNFSRLWTDEELYAKYNLTPEETAFIESMIKPMQL